jgi:Family of unknown function (DUF6624)
VLLLPVVSLLFFQNHDAESVLAARIRHLLHIVISTADEKQEAAAAAEAKEIFRMRGLPPIAAVGDEAAYEFVVLTCSRGPAEFQQQVLRKAREGATRREIPRDAVSYCAAHVSQEIAKAKAGKRAPADPALRDEIEQFIKADQAVREKDGFDMQRMMRVDREHAPALEAIFEKYGVPSYRLVGPQAASDFITMIQHQPFEFRSRVLPRLKANVDAGEADPRSYALMLDRLRTDAGQKQVYGENLTCDTQHPALHTGPIEDQDHVNQRRAAIGLVRLELYAQIVVEMSPNVCGAAPEKR